MMASRSQEHNRDRAQKVWRQNLESKLDSHTKLLVGWIALEVGITSFVATELMQYELVPDLGRHGERMVAEFFSALILGGLAAGLASKVYQQRQATVLRMQVISDMNHHIRNALMVILLSADAIEDQQRIGVISESVDRIEWALREILPRQRPLEVKERTGLGYFPPHRGARGASGGPKAT